MVGDHCAADLCSSKLAFQTLIKTLDSIIILVYSLHDVCEISHTYMCMMCVRSHTDPVDNGGRAVKN